MTTKEYLMQYINAKKRLKAISEEMILIRLEAMKITPVISDIPSGYRVNDKIELSAEKLDECAAKLEKETKRLQRAMEDVEKAISSVSNAVYRQLLTLRYMNGYSLEQIAVAMNYSYRNVTRLHGKALSKVVLVCPTQRL